MADPAAAVTIEKDGRRYTLYIGNRALRLIEQRTGRPATQIEQMSITDLTIFLWAALQHYHPSLDLDDVDEIIDAFGYETIGHAIAQALSAAFGKGGQGNAHPIGPVVA